MYSFAILVNSRTLSDLVKIVRHLKLLLCSRVKSLSMIESHDALVDIINGFNDVLDENQHKDGETSYEEIFDDDKIGICKQPFGFFNFSWRRWKLVMQEKRIICTISQSSLQQ